MFLNPILSNWETSFLKLGLSQFKEHFYALHPTLPPTEHFEGLESQMPL